MEVLSTSAVQRDRALLQPRDIMICGGLTSMGPLTLSEELAAQEDVRSLRLTDSKV